MSDLLKERGFFWWFNDDAHPANSKRTGIPAMLTIGEDGGIELETEGSLCAKDEHTDWSKPRTFPDTTRIAGRLVSSGDYVMLEGLERTDFHLSDDEHQPQTFRAQLCVRRDHEFPETYNLENLIELRIELDGFEEWLRLDSIVVKAEYPTDGETKVEVSYRESSLRTETLGGSLSVDSITTGAGIALTLFGSDMPRRHAEFKQHYYLVFTPESSTHLSSLRYTYTKLEELVSLLIGSSHRLLPPVVVSKEEPSDAWNTIYFSSATSATQPMNSYRIWIPFSKVRDRFGELFRNWLIGSESFGAGFYLYVSSLRNPHHYLEDRFVNLVWGIEALHRNWLSNPENSETTNGERERVQRVLARFETGSDDEKWLRKRLAHAHEPSLETRILQCLRKLPFKFGKSQLEKFSKACADRRNDISHAGGPREGVDYEAFHQEIARLGEALGHLFHALLLQQVGVGPEVLYETFSNSMVSDRIRRSLEDAGVNMLAPPTSDTPTDS